MKLLLEREDVNPDFPDNGGLTPLSWAAKEGNHGVVKLLLGWEDVNPDMPKKIRSNPLSLAFMKRHKGAVKLLQIQARKSANPGPA